MKKLLTVIFMMALPVSAQYIITGPGAGGSPQVNVYHVTSLTQSFNAFTPSFTGGVSVAMGDVNGDGTPDFIVGAGPGGAPEVTVFDGKTQAVIYDFLAYPAGFTGGVEVASGDVNGDGYDDIITAPGSGAGPIVEVFDGKTGSLSASFNAYSPEFTGGVHVGAADVDGDGKADIITGAGAGGGPEVKVFRGTDQMLLADFFAFTQTFTGGVYVAGADINGDGHADLICGAGAGGGQVAVFDGTSQTLLQSFKPFGALSTAGIRVGVTDVNGDAIPDIVAAQGPGPAALVVVNTGPSFTSQPVSFYPYTSSFTGGVFVGGALPRPTAAVSGSAAICPGASTTLSVALTGRAPWSIVWNDTTMQSDLMASPATRLVSADGTYSLTSVTDGNHLLGTSTGVATVTTAAPPSISSQPAGVTISAGNTASLSVTASDATSYQWSMGTEPGGTPINGATSSSFMTPPLSVTTSYWVRVANATCSTDSMTAIVSVPLAPAAVQATASSPTTVGITWGSVAGAASYDIYRSPFGSNFSKIGSTGTPGYADMGVAPNTAYLYRVTANDSGGHTSPPSLPDLATTVIFTDGTLQGTIIKAVHVNELRIAVNAVRALANWSAYSFTDPSIVAGATVKAVDVTDLRTALNQAFSSLPLPPPLFTNSGLAPGSIISAVDLTDIRTAVH